jgi:polyhydroxyalkanoate synthesis regulator phasin
MSRAENDRVRNQLKEENAALRRNLEEMTGRVVELERQVRERVGQLQEKLERQERINQTLREFGDAKDK